MGTLPDYCSWQKLKSGEWQGKWLGWELTNPAMGKRKSNKCWVKATKIRVSTVAWTNITLRTFEECQCEKKEGASFMSTMHGSETMHYPKLTAWIFKRELVRGFFLDSILLRAQDFFLRLHPTAVTAEPQFELEHPQFTSLKCC